eukprot:5116777-Pyramimonas_sp.AAC.1
MPCAEWYTSVSVCLDGKLHAARVGVQAVALPTAHACAAPHACVPARQADRQTGRQADRQTGRQPVRQQESEEGALMCCTLRGGKATDGAVEQGG